MQYKKTTCEHCHQTTDYTLTLDAGTAHIMIAIANAVRRLDRNRIHLQKEMEGRPEEFANYRDMLAKGYMTSRMEGNASKPRYHGLIAKTENRGEYVITKKGAAFLRGIPVQRTAVISKIHGCNVGYFEGGGHATISQILVKEPYWWGGFEDARLPASDVLSETVPMDL